MNLNALGRSNLAFSRCSFLDGQSFNIIGNNIMITFQHCHFNYTLSTLFIVAKRFSSGDPK